jgi:hypothetical protein
MIFTGFFPIFLLMFIYASCGANRWAQTMGVACFFQAASPFLIVGGGRLSGVAPAFAVMFLGLWHVFGAFYSRALHTGEKRDRSAATMMLLALVVIGVVGAFLLPRALHGMVHVLPPREGLDSGFTVPLRPAGTNIIQAFYLCCVFVLFASTRFLIAEGIVKREAVIQGITVGAAVSVLCGFYQVVAYRYGLPWPAGVINSNFGSGQLQEQTAMGMKRMSATFAEPSQMSMHFLGAFGFLALGLQKRTLGFLLLAALLVSTSSTAYFGLIGLLAIWTLMDLPRRAGKAWPLLVLVVIGVAVAFLLDHVLAHGRFSEQLLFRKFEAGSGSLRLNADLLALRSFTESFGLGAGLGSARASSLPASLLATMGFPGFIVFAIFVWLVVVPALKSRDEIDRALFFGLIGLGLGWVMAVPDLNFPLFWLMAATACARRTPEPEFRPVSLGAEQ